MKRLSEQSIKKYSAHQLAKHLERFMDHHGIDDYRIDLVTSRVFKKYWPTTLPESLGAHSYRFCFTYSAPRGLLGILDEVYSKADKKTNKKT